MWLRKKAAVSPGLYGGNPVAQAALWLGHSAQEHLRTYQHATLADRRELDYLDLIPAEQERVTR